MVDPVIAKGPMMAFEIQGVQADSDGVLAEVRCQAGRPLNGPRSDTSAMGQASHVGCARRAQPGRTRPLEWRQDLVSRNGELGASSAPLSNQRHCRALECR